MKKNIVTLVLGASIILLAGCGAKDTVTKVPMQKQAEKQETKVSEEKVPTPTGKADDTIDAIVDGADSERAQAISDETDVKALTDDSVDSNNLSKTYEQEL
jgi:uncharacterized lipoprotein YajG